MARHTHFPLVFVSLASTAVAGHASGQGCDSSDIFGPVLQTLGTGQQPLGIALGDYNNDGLLDVGVANSGSTSFRAFRGIGGGMFGLLTSLGATAYNTGVIFGDTTGDGIDDIVLIGDDDIPFQEDGQLVSARSLGFGTFEFVSLEATQTREATDIRLADLNDDGILDAVVAGSSGAANPGVSILFGDGGGQFGNPSILFSPSGRGSLAVGDINNDGVLDIVTSGFDSGSIGVHIGLGGATFADEVSLFPVGGRRVELADMNNDGNLDIVSCTTNMAQVLLGNGDGSFGGAIQSLGAPGSNGSALAVGDLNGDGNQDVVIADTVYFRGTDQSFGNDSITVFFGNGDGTMEPGSSYPTLSQPTSVKLGDFDGDGDLDVIYSSRGSNSLQIRLNQCIVGPTIAVQPAALTVVDAGSQATLSVMLGDVGRPPISFQWMRNGEPMSDGGTISGTTTDTLSIGEATSVDSDVYTVVVTNEGGQMTSDPGGLLVRQVCIADMNNDGSLNFFDVSAFLSAFAAGCP